MGIVARNFQWLVNPDGTLDGSFPNGDKNPQIENLVWGAVTPVKAALEAAGILGIEVDTGFSHDVRQYLTGTESASAPITITLVSGDDPLTSGWSNPGAGDNLVHDGVSPGSGSFRIRATASDASYAQTSPISWSCVDEGGGPVDPDDPATIFVVQGASGGGNGSEGSPFNTIQSGINAAGPGDIIELRASTPGGTWTITTYTTFNRVGADGQEIILRVRTGDRVNFYPSTSGGRIWLFDNAAYWLIDNTKGEMWVGNRALWSGAGGGNDSYPQLSSLTMRNSHHIDFQGKSDQILHFAGATGYRGMTIENNCHHYRFKWCDGYGHGSISAPPTSHGDGLHCAGENYILEDCHFSAPFGGHNGCNIYGAFGVARRMNFKNDWPTYTGQPSTYGDRAFAIYPEGTNPAATLGSQSPWGPVLFEDCWVEDAGHDLTETAQMTPQCKTGMHRLIYRYNYEVNNRGGNIIETYLPGPITSAVHNSTQFNRFYNNTSVNCYNWIYANCGWTGPSHQDHRWYDNIVSSCKQKRPDTWKVPTLVWFRNFQRATLQGYPDKWLSARFRRNMIHSDGYRIELQAAGEGGGVVTSLAAAKSTWPSVWHSSNNTNAPEYVNPSAGTRAGYALTLASNGRNEAGAKASVTSNSSGVTVAVDDAYWIYDGFDLAYFGEEGDYVAFYASDGTTLKGIRQVSSVNNKTSITLTSSISLVSGDLVFAVQRDHSVESPSLGDGLTIVRNIGANQS